MRYEIFLVGCNEDWYKGNDALEAIFQSVSTNHNACLSYADCGISRSCWDFSLPSSMSALIDNPNPVNP